MAKSFFSPIFLSFLLAVSYVVGTVPRLHIQSNPKIKARQPGSLSNKTQWLMVWRPHRMTGSYG
jgi:hypothetical protein